jgi:hypothetical protein
VKLARRRKEEAEEERSREKKKKEKNEARHRPCKHVQSDTNFAVPRLYVEPRAWEQQFKAHLTCQMNARVVAVVIESKIERCSVSAIEKREVGDHHFTQQAASRGPNGDATFNGKKLWRIILICIERATSL